MYIKNPTIIKNKKGFVLLLILTLLGLFIYTKTNSNPTLQIEVDAEDFLLTVKSENNTYTSRSNFKGKVKKDLYTISVEKEGYIPEQRQMNIQSNTKVEIKLFKSSLSEIQKSYKQENVKQISMTEAIKNRDVYGIDRKNGNLIKIKDDGEEIIYTGKVKTYSIGENLIVLVDELNLNEIIKIDINTNKISRLEEKDLYPITSVAISDDDQTIFFLAGFKISDKMSSLYSMRSNGNTITKIIETSAQSINYLKKDIILLYEENHDLNKNRVILFNFNTNKEVLSKYTNKYNISPSGNNILLHKTNNIEILDTSNYRGRSQKISESSRSIWKDDNTLFIFRNAENNIYYTKVTVEPFSVGNFSLLFEKMSLQNIFGFLNNRIYLQDYENKIFSIELK